VGAVLSRTHQHRRSSTALDDRGHRLRAAVRGGCGLAVLALRRTTPWRLERAAEPALTTLHRLHSGNVGDYVAWLVLGVTAFGALVLVAS